MPMPFNLTTVPAPRAQENAREFELAAGPDAQALIRSQSAVVLLEPEFFDRLRREFDMIDNKEPYEWPLYGPMTRIFDRFSETLRFKNSGHIACYSQPSFIPPRPAKELKSVAGRAKSCTPDSAGLRVPAAGGKDAANWVYWWDEDKPLTQANIAAVRRIDRWIPADTTNFVQVYGMQKLIRQLNIQALYAFLCYGDPSNGLAHPGFFAFLTIGHHFTLFQYHKPDDWATIAKKVKDKRVFESTSVFPDVVMYNESVLDDKKESFSNQMLVAFELLRLHTQPDYIQPSYYQPRSTLDIETIPFKSKEGMEQVVKRLAEETTHNRAELTRARSEFPSPQTPKNISPYRGTKPREALGAPRRSSRPKSQKVQAAAARNAEPEEDLFMASSSQAGSPPQPLMRTPPNVDTRRLSQRREHSAASDPESPSTNLGSSASGTAALMPLLRFSLRSSTRRAPRGSRDHSLAAGLGGVTLESNSDEQADSAEE